MEGVLLCFDKLLLWFLIEYPSITFSHYYANILEDTFSDLGPPKLQTFKIKNIIELLIIKE